MDIKIKQKNRIRRHKRVRAVIKGTSERPRLSVFRSNKRIYAQLVDDSKGITLLSASDIKASALKIGENLAKKALEKGIEAVVFDRGGYKYHGQIKALAEGARKGGLKL
ncbi:MAG: 50S ribosomal protein L18 [Parcubacteria group bacterium]|nr:50S ribosomal protein L18 [Parcubacteria group bacterium]